MILQKQKQDTLTKCGCGTNEDMQHIYNCELLSDNKQKSLAYIQWKCETTNNGEQNIQT